MLIIKTSKYIKSKNINKKKLLIMEIALLCLFVYFVIVCLFNFRKDKLIFSTIGSISSIIGLLCAIAMQFDSQVLYVIAYSLQFLMLGTTTVFSAILSKQKVIKILSIIFGISGIVINIILGL